MIRLHPILPVVLLMVAIAAAQPDAPKPQAAAPGDSLAFVSLNVAKAWDHMALGAVREAPGRLQFAWALQSAIGVAPVSIERITAFWLPSSPDVPLILLTGRKPLDGRAIAKELRKPGAKAAHAKPPANVFAAPGAEFALILQIDARTVLLAPNTIDPAKLEGIAKGQPGSLAAAIAAAGNHTLTIGLNVPAFGKLPLAVGAPLLDAETAVLTADLGKESEGTAELRLQFKEESKAEKAAPILKEKLKSLADWAAAQKKRIEAKPPKCTGYPAPLLEWIAATLKGAVVKANGAAVVARSNLNTSRGVAALMMALPESAFAVNISDRAGENNVKQIVLAFHNYVDANGRCVSNSYDKDGKPLLSWRVHLLPYIEQGALYNLFKLDEPWDSEHNKPLSQTAIKVFQCPGHPAALPWETYFRGFIGPKDVKPEHRPWLLEGETKGPNFPANFPDGTSNTWLVVEAAESVPWAKPDDLVYDGKRPLPQLGGPRGSYIAGFADGSVQTFRRGQIDEQTLRYLISTADGMPINIPRK